MAGAGQLAAGDATVTVSRGATRDEVIAAYGRPTGQSKVGNIEILHFRNRQVRLENNRVVRVTSIPEPAAPAHSAPVAAAVPAAADVANASPSSTVQNPSEPPSPFAAAWITGFEHATRDAARRDSVILALFTQSDASPAARQFQREIALHRDFVNAFRARYVLLQVDFPAREDLAPALRAENETLRERFGIKRFPAVLILSAAGEKIASVPVDTGAVLGTAYRERLMAAIIAAYTLPAPAPVAHEAPVAAPKPPEPTPVPIVVAPAEVTSGLTTARWLIMAALAGGTLLAGVMLFVLWLFIRKINKPVALNRRSNMATRISQAASGLPSFAEIRAWPKEMLLHVLIRLAEVEGYVADEQPFGSDKDLVLKRPGNPAPEIVICCATGNAGVIPTRKLRELVGIMAAEDVPNGWYVSPSGFSADARTYAEQHNITLIDASRLIDQLSDLPTFALPKVLAPVR